MSEWTVTVNVATPEALPEETLVELDEHAENLSDGSVSSRGLDGPGFTLRCTVPAPTLMRAIDGVVEVAQRLFAYVPDAELVGATGETAALAERHALEPDTPELLAATDVADLLGVSRQRVHQLQTKRADFPAPYQRLGSGPIWTRPAIERFAGTWDRKPGRPSKGKVHRATPARTPAKERSVAKSAARLTRAANTARGRAASSAGASGLRDN